MEAQPTPLALIIAHFFRRGRKSALSAGNAAKESAGHGNLRGVSRLIPLGAETEGCCGVPPSRAFLRADLWLRLQAGDFVLDKGEGMGE